MLLHTDTWRIEAKEAYINLPCLANPFCNLEMKSITYLQCNNLLPLSSQLLLPLYIDETQVFKKTKEILETSFTISLQSLL